MQPSEPKKRAHRATGKKPPGGARAGAGRPEGSNGTLPHGTVQALKALRHRVPEGTPEPLAELADSALQYVADVLKGTAMPDAVKLKAAQVARDEVCGPLAKKHEVSGALSITVLDPYATPEGGA